MNHFATPAFVFCPYNPSTSPGFVLVLKLSKLPGSLSRLRTESLDFFTGGRPSGCLAVLLVGLTDQPSPDQTRQIHQLSHQWGVAIEAVKSAEVAGRFGSWLLGEFHRFFHHCREGGFPGSLRLACLKQMSQDAVTEYAREPLAALTHTPAS